MRDILIAFLKTGSGVLGRLIFGAATTKIVALILGPSGVGLFSLLRLATDVSNSFGTLGGRTALVQGLASRKGQVRDEYLVTTFFVFVLGALSIAGALLLFASWIAFWVFGHNDSETIGLVRWLALPVGLSVAASYIYGVLNGFRAIGLLALVQILGAAAMTLLAYPVSRWVEVGYNLAFIGMLSAPPLVIIVLGVYFALRAGWLTPLLHSLRIKVSSNSLRHFFSIASVLVITESISMAAILAISSLTVHYNGFVAAGIFSAAYTLSITYTMIIIESFDSYYLPTLSRTADPQSRVLLMQRMSRVATLLMVPLVTSVIVLKPLAIELLYSDEFISSLEILRWLLISNYFWVTTFVFLMPMIAYADMKVFFWTEFLAYASLLAFVALALFGFSSMQGIGVGYLLVDAAYCAYCLYYARSRHQFLLTRAAVVPWSLGLALIVGASAYTWSHAQVHWFSASLWIGAAVGFSWWSLNRNEQRDLLLMLLRREGVQP